MPNDSCFGMPNTIPGDEYVLRMDAETAHIVARACELYARLRNGQFEELRYLTVWPTEAGDKTFGKRIDQCSAALLQAKTAAFPEFSHPYSQSYGIGHFRDSDVAWNVYQAVRYIMAWHEHPEGGDTVDFRKPLKYSDAPMPRCECRNGDLHWHNCVEDGSPDSLIDVDTTKVYQVQARKGTER